MARKPEAPTAMYVFWLCVIMAGVGSGLIVRKVTEAPPLHESRKNHKPLDQPRPALKRALGDRSSAADWSVAPDSLSLLVPDSEVAAPVERTRASAVAATTPGNRTLSQSQEDSPDRPSGASSGRHPLRKERPRTEQAGLGRARPGDASQVAPASDPPHMRAVSPQRILANDASPRGRTTPTAFDSRRPMRSSARNGPAGSKPFSASMGAIAPVPLSETAGARGNDRKTLRTVSLPSDTCDEGNEQACKRSGSKNSETSSSIITTSNEEVSEITATGVSGYRIPCAGLSGTVRAPGKRTHAIDWGSIPTSGAIGTDNDQHPINVYIREACDKTNIKTVVIGSSIHATENHGQPISFDLLTRNDLPGNMRVIAIPEINVSKIVSASGSGRVNSRNVNLNRNFDYRWSSMSGGALDPNDPDKNYRGTGPASEPEAKALVSFLESIGSSVSLFVVYHANLGYVGASNKTDPSIAAAYRTVLTKRNISMKLGNVGGTNIYQKGSLDGWFQKKTGKPTLLIEMPPNSSAEDFKTHADAIVVLVNTGKI